MQQRSPVPSTIIHTFPEELLIDHSIPWLLPPEVQINQMVLDVLWNPHPSRDWVNGVDIAIAIGHLIRWRDRKSRSINTNSITGRTLKLKSPTRWPEIPHLAVLVEIQRFIQSKPALEILGQAIHIRRRVVVSYTAIHTRLLI